MEREVVKMKRGRKGDLVGMIIGEGIMVFLPDRKKPGRFSEAQPEEEWIVVVTRKVHPRLFIATWVRPLAEEEAERKAAIDEAHAAFVRRQEAPRVSFDGRGWRIFNIEGAPGFTREKKVAAKWAAMVGLKLEEV